MKISNLFFLLSVTLLLSGLQVNAQFDDLYFDHKTDKISSSQTVAYANKNESRSRTSNVDQYTESQNSDNYYYEDDSAYYSEYDYAYSTRIQRFHRSPMQMRSFNNFDYWYNDFYYDPFFDNRSSVNIFIGTPMFGFNRWNRWNSFNRWNSWGYHDPWGYNNFGWNSWNNCPSNFGWNGFGNNIYYVNNYGTWNNNNNGGWNGWNGGSGGGWNGVNPSTNNTIFQSRRGSSLSTSTKGRDASPRREVSGTNPTNLTPSSTNIDRSLDGADSANPSGRAVTTRPSNTNTRTTETNTPIRGSVPTEDSRGATPQRETERSSIYNRPSQRTDVRETEPTRTQTPTRTPSQSSPSRSNDTPSRSPAQSAPSRSNNTPSSSPQRSTPSSRGNDSGSMRSSSGSSNSSMRSSGGSSSGSSMRSSGGGSSSSSRSSSGGSSSRRGG